MFFFFFSSRRRHTRFDCDWSSDVCSSDLDGPGVPDRRRRARRMSRHVLTVDLRDDPAAIASYREHHRRVWPEVIESLREAGVERMDIHLLGRRLVMIVELRTGLDYQRTFAAHVASSPR